MHGSASGESHHDYHRFEHRSNCFGSHHCRYVNLPTMSLIMSLVMDHIEGLNIHLNAVNLFVRNLTEDLAIDLAIDLAVDLAAMDQ